LNVSRCGIRRRKILYLFGLARLCYGNCVDVDNQDEEFAEVIFLFQPVEDK
jgi:hypothetical protein